MGLPKNIRYNPVTGKMILPESTPDNRTAQPRRKNNKKGGGKNLVDQVDPTPPTTSGTPIGLLLLLTR